MASKPRAKMEIPERAKQFMPFSAVHGLEAALAAKERVVVPPVTLTEDMAEELDRRLRQLTVGQMVTVVYFCRGEYRKLTGMVAKIEETSRILQVVATRVAFGDIASLSIE